MKRHFPHLQAPLAVCLSLCVAAAAAADPVPGELNFNELPNATVGVHLPAGYGGFNWGDRWYQMSPTVGATDTNFLATSVTGGTLIRRVDGSAFYFDGADFWSRRGADAVGDFFFVLYGASGQVLYNGDVDNDGGRMRFSGTPTFLQANYSGPIHGMAWGFDNDDYDHMAMDNFRFRAEPLAAVPEPGSGALLALGLAGLAALKARRRRGG